MGCTSWRIVVNIYRSALVVMLESHDILLLLCFVQQTPRQPLATAQNLIDVKFDSVIAPFSAPSSLR